ncbi:MAG TPA: GNAT family N-acetyltransferase [Anaerolineaceae bacterium]|nr:GNAT family N-acetyltransferase [Anaerolineaceae bacterium]HPN52443.1 GNAT family N-acetyltransferase [Anaerolineaceae bacterium]
MNTFLFADESHAEAMRALIRCLPGPSSIADFEENIQMESIRSNTRLWEQDGQLAAFAYVDDYNNLCYEIDPQIPPETLEAEIVAWGVACIQRRNAETGEEGTLDFSCSASDTQRMALTRNYGFEELEVRSLHYSRSLEDPLPDFPLAAGFTIRPAAGEPEVEALVALHCAATGSDAMTVEERLAIMRSPEYIPELDLLAVAPNGDLAAYCVCGFEDGSDGTVGYTDPIGTHPQYQKLGLAKALVAAAFKGLKARGAVEVRVGTSSENMRMQRLAESLGFKLVSERLWFAKPVS